MTRKLIVIGGGAAGFWGAIAAAQAQDELSITILEASHQLLTKVRISGGGRCNVTHACFDPTLLVGHYPRGSKALRGAFTRFQPQDTVQWFEAHGVRLKTEADGRIFPTTNDSETIIACLLRTAKQLGIAIRTGVPVTTLTKAETRRFEVGLKGGEVLGCDRILLATGSHPLGYRLAQQLGHPLVSPVPSLFTFKIRDQRLEDLAGISVDPVHLHLCAAEQTFEQTGPLLVTHWGLSGPAVLKLSAWGARALHQSRYRGVLTVNWLPHRPKDALRQTILNTKVEGAKRAIANHCPVEIPQRLWQRLLVAAQISPQQRWADLSKQNLRHLLLEISQSQFQIMGKGIFKEEFVTCGGVDLQDINFKTMESRHCPGLYFAGEVIDVDGITGGFNFQNAWTTAWLAAQALGQSCH
ncbi:MAG: NAD(P)/FAD-dependent oxidoreductase [Acaryochloris sp. RU_4_1]|nr:NAD(P)/FAD-dependent oxidoreductase [Acaryochloris sp. SU_5_25]NJM64347.1 NAD(P)/FAD-dependent oxidoreductase [Acaryochloris sp. RU_4_1]NJR53638.1 NAD(P)/FAD-dependent oxidoreductase [Acaryochloris sp. CRU_2_0]